MPFRKAYSYGTSTKNQRIEHWWNLLTEGQTQEWKVYFAELEGNGYFDGSAIDKSCLQFIYMEIIRTHIHQFVAIHNSHKIRKQPTRAHYLPTGQPFMLYHYPDGVRDYKEAINIDLLSALESEVADFDLDSYLPTATMTLYTEFLRHGNFPAELSYNSTQHKQAYLFLREKATSYLQTGGVIELFEMPTGADQWITAHQNHEIEQYRQQRTADPLHIELTDEETSTESVLPSNSNPSSFHNSHNYTFQQSTTVSRLTAGQHLALPEDISSESEQSDDGYILNI